MAYYAVRSYDFPALLTHLHGRMMTVEAGHRWYALVDTAFDHEGKVLHIPGSDGYAVYHEGQFAALSGVSPVLYGLSVDCEPLKRQLSRLLHHCNGRPMLSFIRSGLPAGDLRDHWQSLLEVRTEDKERYLLRFGDTRVLPTLAVQGNIWKRLAAGVTAWWSIGRDGELRDLALPTTPEHNEGTLEIGNECLSGLLNAGSVDAMANYMSEYFPELLAMRDGYSNYEMLEQTMALCSEVGVFGTTEQYAIGVGALFSDGKLLVDPEISTWLSEKTWGEKGIEDALTEFMENKGFS